MFELFDEWRARGQRHPPHDLPDPLGATQLDPMGTIAERTHPPPLEAFGPCPVCSGDRDLRTEPLAGDTVRLALVCADCGLHTAI